MEVICERCHTEYEFDDALVSERGTTVKCTNCGHQFRIFRKKGQEAVPPERWVVRISDGQELVFTSIRDLQRAITRGRIAPKDVLVREGMAPRKLENIAELEPFFRTTRSAKPPPVAMPRGPMTTSPGLGGTSGKTVPMSEADAEFEEKTIPRFTPSTDGLPPKPSSPAYSEGGLSTTSNTQKPPKPLPAAGRAPEPKPRVVRPATAKSVSESKPDPEVTPAPKPESKPEIEPRSKGDEEPNEQPQEDSQESTESAEASKKESTSNNLDDATKSRTSSSPDNEERDSREDSGAVMTPTPPSVRVARYEDDGMTDPRFLSTPPQPPKSKARWLVAVVIVAGLAVLGLTVGKSYLPHLSSTPGNANESGNSTRLDDLLKTGKVALRRGDLDEANAAFVKASALDDSNPQVLENLARLASIRADTLWLRLRMLGDEQSDLKRITQMELQLKVKQALKTSSKALEAAPSSADAIATRVDALRIAGKLEDARALVGRLNQQGTDPNQAYAAAMLQAAEKKPDWSKVVEGMRVAVTGDERAARALGALVFALAKSGDTKEAASHLKTLEKFQPPYPLLVELRKVIGSPSLATDAGTEEKKDSGRASKSSNAQSSEGSGSGLQGEYEGADSYQALMDKAHAAHRAGQLDRAERLYRQVLAKNPGDTEALAGLGDIAKARGDSSAAMGYYNQVAQGNPSYLPALVGLADSKWASGDHDGAVALYQQIVQQTGGVGSYAQHAKQRIAQAAAEKNKQQTQPDHGPTPTSTDKPAPTVTETAKPPPPPPPPKDTSGSSPSTPPGVDTSDLPGWSSD